MNKKTIRDVELAGKRVLVRVDFNVPLEDGRVADDTRIRAALPTLNYILEQRPKALILMSHLGRPKGERDPEASLRPVVEVLAKHLDVPVQFSEEAVGEKAKAAVAALPEAGVLLLENTRYYAGETKNDGDMAKQLAVLGDIFVNDAFGSAHRAHASTVGVTKHLEAVAGFLMEKELDFLVNAIENAERPFIAILGGAKVSDKVQVIEALLQKVDKLLIGGGMANTFFRAKDYYIGESLVEEEAVEVAKKLLAKSGDKLVLPSAVVIADAFDNDANRKTVIISEGVPDGWRILDLGAASISAYQAELLNAKTVVWNGPMGVFEMPNFAHGTLEIAETLAEITANNGAVTIIGGGDSASAVAQANLADKMTHISTGGGASLELLEGQALPGVEALANQ